LVIDREAHPFGAGSLNRAVALSSRRTVRRGSAYPSAGVFGPIVWGPVAHGMSSQYWLTALTIGLAHGLPGAPEAAVAEPALTRATHALSR
jgi:hypothetical protein